MRWKKTNSNLIVVCLLSIVYTVVTLLVIIGPLHMNATGGMYHLSAISLYVLIYWICSLLFSWFMYTALRNFPKLLFFLLIISGICIIVAEIFLWGSVGP